LATLTPGFAGADIANVCNEAALIAARHGDKVRSSGVNASTQINCRAHHNFAIILTHGGQ